MGIAPILPALNKVLLHAAFDFRLNVAFNTGMDDATPHSDWTLITDLGGPAKVAEMLTAAGESECSVQRVQNWKYRGIPPAVKLKHPSMFLPGFGSVAAPADTPTEKAA